jgi:hypothetical protein
LIKTLKEENAKNYKMGSNDKRMEMVLQHKFIEMKSFNSGIIAMNGKNQNSGILEKFRKTRLVLIAVSFLTFISCKKEDTQQLPPEEKLEMEYFDLSNKEIKAFAPGFSIDVNHDGRNDLKFGTLLVGDPIEQVDKIQFFISTNIGICLPVNNNENIPVLSTGDSIVLDDFNGYQWFELSTIVLVQKVISDNNPDSWDGAWKDVSHKFIPFQVKNSDKRYNGWIEISVDISNEKLILHKAAIGKTADKIIYAGK